jgi:hypothetical protein
MGGVAGRPTARGKILVPGVVNRSTDVVEHPDLVA